MRSLIFIFLISLSLSSRATEFCSQYESIKLIKTGDSLILKCDCNCTNEENKFYTNSMDPESIINASRLLSSNGIAFAEFDLMKKNNNICKWQDYNPSYEKGIIFATKVPDGERTCFEIKKYSIPKLGASTSPIYYSVKESSEFNKIAIGDEDTSLSSLGVNELSNKLLIDNQVDNFKVYLKKGEIVKSKYTFDDKVVVMKGEQFIEVKSRYLEPYFYINKKAYLYANIKDNEPKNMYLIKGDKVVILDEAFSNKDKRYLINYKGKKDINMWIKADSVELN